MWDRVLPLSEVVVRTFYLHTPFHSAVNVDGRRAEGDQPTFTNTYPRNQSNTLYDTTATSDKQCSPTNPFIPASGYNQPATDSVSVPTY